MHYIKKIFREYSTSVELSVLDTVKEVKEYNLILQVIDLKLPFDDQVSVLLKTYETLRNEELKNATPVFMRCFLSDMDNQWAVIEKKTPQCAVFYIEQPPLNGTKIALWIYLQSDVETARWHQGLFLVKHRNRSYTHLWGSNVSTHTSDAECQTRYLFNDYISRLEDNQCTLAANCLRTWLFVRDIDLNYRDVVKARNEVFSIQNLTDQTHFIASTGIEGRGQNPHSLVQMDTYAIKGITEGQIRYLHASTNMNPTHEYGVSFERGTCISYEDRRCVLISGTASIDNKGRIIYQGDVLKQTVRMWENVEVLLREAECIWENVAQMIVYLRDMADYQVIKELFDMKFPDIPKVLVLASVCRPGWLIEMECIALKAE